MPAKTTPQPDDLRAELAGVATAQHAQLEQLARGVGEAVDRARRRGEHDRDAGAVELHAEHRAVAAVHLVVAEPARPEHVAPERDVVRHQTAGRTERRGAMRTRADGGPRQPW